MPPLTATATFTLARDYCKQDRGDRRAEGDDVFAVTLPSTLVINAKCATLSKVAR
jgi:hypothetical protein